MPAASPETRVLVVEDDERTARWLVRVRFGAGGVVEIDGLGGRVTAKK